LGAWLAAQKVGTTAARWADWKDEKLVEMWDDVLVVELESNLVVQLVATKVYLSDVMSVEWKDVN
jgi:hypothetical protein